MRRPRLRSLVLVPLTIAVTVFGLLWGGRSSYIAIRNRAPVEITCADFLRKPPDAEWLRLTDCVPDFDHLGVNYTTQLDRYGHRIAELDEVTGLYIPLYPSAALTTSPSALVLSTMDPRLLRMVDRNTERRGREVARPLDGPFEGVVELVVDRSERHKGELRALHLHLADDFSILALDDHLQPLWKALGALLLGLGGAWRISCWFRRRTRGAVTLPTATVVAK